MPAMVFAHHNPHSTAIFAGMARSCKVACA